MKDKIKYQFANAMKQCMEKTPLEKITIKQLVDVCGMSRQTFYRHFIDKYDLINWYFEKILLKSFKHMGNGKTIKEALVNKFNYIKEENKFFKVAFENDKQNNLKEYDFALILDFYTKRIEERSHKPLSNKIRFLLEMYCQGSIYMTMQWVFGKLEISSEKLAKELIEAMPSELSNLFQQLELL